MQENRSKKQQHKKIIPKEEIKQISICRYGNCPNDTPNGFAHLACRAAYTFIAWFVLGNNILSGQSFFVSITLFVLPLFMDYMKFTPCDYWRNLLRKISLVITAIFVFIGILGMMNVLTLIDINGVLSLSFSDSHIAFKNISLGVEKLYYLMLSACFLTITDWVANSSPSECKNNERS